MMDRESPSDHPIVTIGLVKRFKKFTSVDDLDLSVRKGSFTGLLGPNGAGKSTTLKIMTSLLRPTSGQAYVNGVDVSKDPKAALTGVGTVVETPEFYLYMSPKETFKYIGEIFGMSKESISYETDDILNKVKMAEWADKKVGTFSKGMRQRVALGLSLMNDPEILILDEPTSGLDPRGTAETRDILKDLRKRCRDLTILMSSHMLHEVSELCDRIAIIDHGRLLIHDDMSSVMSSVSSSLITLKTVRLPGGSVINRIGELSCVRHVTVNGNDIEVTLESGIESRVQFFKSISEMNMEIYSVKEGENSLEKKYLEMIRGDEHGL